MGPFFDKELLGPIISLVVLATCCFCLRFSFALFFACLFVFCCCCIWCQKSVILKSFAFKNGWEFGLKPGGFNLLFQGYRFALFFYYCGDRERRKILLNMLLCPTLPYIRTVSLCPLLLVSLPLSSSSRESGLELSREGNILNITEHIAIQKDYVKWNMGINDISRILLVY